MRQRYQRVECLASSMFSHGQPHLKNCRRIVLIMKKTIIPYCISAPLLLACSILAYAGTNGTNSSSFNHTSPAARALMGAAILSNTTLPHSNRSKLMASPGNDSRPHSSRGRTHYHSASGRLPDTGLHTGLHNSLHNGSASRSHYAQQRPQPSGKARTHRESKPSRNTTTLETAEYRENGTQNDTRQDGSTRAQAGEVSRMSGGNKARKQTPRQRRTAAAHLAARTASEGQVSQQTPHADRSDALATQSHSAYSGQGGRARPPRQAEPEVTLLDNNNFSEIHQGLNGKYRLVEPIDLAGSSHNPIGNEGPTLLRGVWTEKDYPIRGLNINRNSTQHAGLFGYANNSDIDVVLDRPLIRGNPSGVVAEAGSGNKINASIINGQARCTSTSASIICAAGLLVGRVSGSDNRFDQYDSNGDVTIRTRGNIDPRLQQRRSATPPPVVATAG